MPKYYRDPTGRKIGFPDSMSESEIKDVMRLKFGGPDSKSLPKTGYRGIAQDIMESLASVPSAVTQMVSAAPEALYEGGKQLVTDPGRALSNLAVGGVEGIEGLGNIPSNIARYMQQKEIGRGPLRDFISALRSPNVSPWLKVAMGKEQPGDPMIRGIGSFAPYMIPGGELAGLRGLGARTLATGAHSIGQGQDPVQAIALGLLGEGAGKIAKSSPKLVKEGSKSAIAKIGSTTTGVAEKNIKTLLEKGDEVAKMIKESGGDLTAEADNLRRNLTDSIQATKKKANSAISKAINESPSTVGIENTAPIKAAKNIADGLAKIADSKEIKEINKVIVKKIEKSSRNGILSLKEAQSLKQQFDNMSKPTYTPAGKIYANSSGVRRAAKAAANKLRGPIAELSPEIGKSNNILRKLHKIEKNINKNLIAEGKPDVSLFAAGSGTHKRNASMLKELGEITGTKPLEEAEKLSAARAFADTNFLPSDTTGKSYTRLFASTGIGGAAGGGLGVALGALASSPTVLKNAIRAGQVTAKNAKKIFNIATPQVKSLLIQSFGMKNFPNASPAMQIFIKALRDSSQKDNKE